MKQRNSNGWNKQRQPPQARKDRSGRLSVTVPAHYAQQDMSAHLVHLRARDALNELKPLPADQFGRGLVKE